jgi:hypothetical protein
MTHPSRGTAVKVAGVDERFEFVAAQGEYVVLKRPGGSWSISGERRYSTARLAVYQGQALGHDEREGWVLGDPNARRSIGGVRPVVEWESTRR